MKILFVGGSFDKNGGRSSSLVKKITEEIKNNGYNNITIHNGGTYDELKDYLKSVKNYNVVFWWANVPNDYQKIRNVKEINPMCMLITSKRNDNNKYAFSQLISRSLEQKANLTVEFSKENEIFNMMLFDPLGNQWYKGDNISKCVKILMDRLTFLKNIKRQGTIKSKELVTVPEETEFFDLIKSYAEVFHTLINPDENITRFLGNSSYRCQRGFPSFKSGNYIFVSRRNVDKRYINRENFVPTYFKDNKIYYVGNNKPSVDTPIQLRLYNKLPKINYMIHAHVYIKDAKFTKLSVPCGAIEEVEEILNVIDNNGGRNKDYYAINLIGHGCIVMAASYEQLKNINYIPRIFPEVMQE